jgi:hypothetical protein
LLAERLIALEPNPRLEHVEAVDERLPGALGRKQNDGLSDSLDQDFLSIETE